MKLAALSFLTVSALAFISSDAHQHGKDIKRIRRDLKTHHHHATANAEKTAKSAKEKAAKSAKVDGASPAPSTVYSEGVVNSEGVVTSDGTDGMVKSDSMMAVAAELSSSMSMQSYPMSMASDSTSLPTFSPTLAPSIEVESVQAADPSPACPPAYDITKTDYVGGELVEMDDNIFECHSLYVMYCNIGEWDDALLAQDASAEEMWNDAWAHVGPCSKAEDEIPTCPPTYDIAKTDYLGGDTVTITENIFECHALYVMYCNIGEWDDALLAQDANAEELWNDAWVHVGPCSIPAVVSESTFSPTPSPTLAPSVEVASVQAADAISACPPAYDTTKTDYLGGDMVTVDGNIFKCHSLYVMYCNIGVWDDALLARDANAEEMWDDSWVFVGPCA